MTLWIIEPHDALVFRDSRPFHATPGAKANTLPFPFPSTLAGAVRTQAGLDENGSFIIPSQELDELKKMSVCGPFLAQLQADGSIEHLLLPAPLDALVLSSKEDEDKDEDKGKKTKKVQIARLLPLALPEGAVTDLLIAGQEQLTNGQAQQQPIYFVGQPIHNPAKVDGEALAYWQEAYFRDWLLQDDNPKAPVALWQEVEPAKLGIKALSKDTRVHIRMDAAPHVAADGALFQTVGLEFTMLQKSAQEQQEDESQSQPGLHDAHRLALVVKVDEGKFRVHEGLSYLGGERRIVNWQDNKDRGKETLLSKPATLFEKSVGKIVDKRACRLILLTPAHFEQGYWPQWFIEDALKRYQLSVTISAIAIQRPQVVSGWDIAARKAKQSRRLAPAGSVLFLKFAPNASKQTIRDWVQDRWLHSISDDEQDRYDGGGIAIFGTWSGEAVPANVQKV